MDDPPTTPLHPLFMDVPSDKAYASLRAKAFAAIDELTSGVRLTADLPELRQRLVATYRFGLLELQWDHPAAREADEGSSFRVLVPFTGASGLFDMRPTRHDGERPVGWVREQHLVLVLPADRDTAPRVFDRQKALVHDWVSRINHDATAFNERLARDIRTRLTYQASRLGRLPRRAGGCLIPTSPPASPSPVRPGPAPPVGRWCT